MNDDGYYGKTPYAIRLKPGGRWYIAVKARASDYGNQVTRDFVKSSDVWSDPETTGLLCAVGDELDCVNLDDLAREMASA
jgi:hypothetical protein